MLLGMFAEKIKEKLCKTASSNQQMIKCLDGLIEDRRELRGELSLSAEWINRGGLCHVKNGLFKI